MLGRVSRLSRVTAELLLNLAVSFFQQELLNFQQDLVAYQGRQGDEELLLAAEYCLGSEETGKIQQDVGTRAPGYGSRHCCLR